LAINYINILLLRQHSNFIGEALLVVKNGDNFTVVEGNRRLTSLKLLSNPSLATIRVNKVISNGINFICCMIYPDKLFAIICISCLFNSGDWTSIAFHALKYEIVLMTLFNWGTFEKIEREYMGYCGFWGYIIIQMIKDDCIKPDYLASNLNGVNETGVYMLDNAAPYILVLFFQKPPKLLLGYLWAEI
jgi:hypothetical protein